MQTPTKLENFPNIFKKCLINYLEHSTNTFQHNYQKHVSLQMLTDVNMTFYNLSYEKILKLLKIGLPYCLH